MQRKQAAEVFEALAQPFQPDELEWRQGTLRFDKSAVMMLPYVTNRAIMDRLDKVVGPPFWGEEYRSVRENSKGWICQLSIQLVESDGRVIDSERPYTKVLHVTHEDAADETDIEATKGGASDSMKRAAVKFGIGRYLYNLPQFWAPTVERGGKFYPDPKWRPTLPPWALPSGSPRPAPSSPAPEPRPQAQPAKPQAQAVASSTQDDEDPDTGLPPGPPPFDIVTRCGIGFYKEYPWAHLAMGSIGGRRHGYLQWAAQTWDPQKPATKKVKALLQWMEGKAAKQENEANAKQDHREEPGHLTDDELAGLYPPGSQPASVWDDPEESPF